MLRIISGSISSTVANSEHVHDRYEGQDFLIQNAVISLGSFPLNGYADQLTRLYKKEKIRNKHKMIGCFPLKSASTALRFWWWNLYHQNKSREGKTSRH